MSDYTVVAKLAGTGETRLENRVVLELPPSLPTNPDGDRETIVVPTFWMGHGDYDAWLGHELATGKVVERKTAWLRSVAEFDYTRTLRAKYPKELCDEHGVPPVETPEGEPLAEVEPLFFHMLACLPSHEPMGRVLWVEAGDFLFVFFHPVGADGVSAPWIEPFEVVGNLRQHSAPWLSVGHGHAYYCGDNGYYSGTYDPSNDIYPTYHPKYRFVQLSLPNVAGGAQIVEREGDYGLPYDPPYQPGAPLQPRRWESRGLDLYGCLLCAQENIHYGVACAEAAASTEAWALGDRPWVPGVPKGWAGFCEAWSPLEGGPVDTYPTETVLQVLDATEHAPMGPEYVSPNRPITTNGTFHADGSYNFIINDTEEALRINKDVILTINPEAIVDCKLEVKRWVSSWEDPEPTPGPGDGDITILVCVPGGTSYTASVPLSSVPYPPPSGRIWVRVVSVSPDGRWTWSWMLH